MFEQRDFSFIYRYFTGEKQESLLFLIVGIVAVLLAVVCWFFIKSNPNFFKGAAIPLLAIGLIQMIVGYSVYSRTEKQRKDIAYNIGIEPVNYVKQTELPRMKTVMKNFVIYRWVEIAFIITGLVLILLFKSNPDKSFWYGFGVALAMQAVMMLGADYFAEQRGKVYFNELEKIILTK
jgi:peptidoglycan/LPS O-acetylase OafA/YrhL